METAEIQVQTENIPDELRSIPRWVTWKYVEKEQGKKPQKLPFDPNTGAQGDSTDPAKWADFDRSLEVYRGGGYAGIGLTFSDDDDITGVDLDHCVDGDNITPWGAAVVALLNTHTETSPSQTGVKMWCHGKKYGTLCQKVFDHSTSEAVEIYEKGRFFTVTGQRWPGQPATVEHRQEELDILYRAVFTKPQEGEDERISNLRSLFPKEQKKTSATPSTAPLMAYSGNGYDDVAKAENALQRLSPWRCDDYNDWMAVGFALCELGAAGLGLWDRWSSQSSKYAPGVCEKKWGSMTPGDGITLGTLFFMANEDDPRSAAVVVARIKEIAGSGVEDAFNVASSELGSIIGFMNRAEHPAVIDSLVDDLGVTKTDAKGFVGGRVADAKKTRAEEKRKAQAAQAAQIRDDDRTIDIAEKQLKTIYRETTSLLVRQVKENPRNPGAYVRGGLLARVATDENKNRTISLLNMGDLQLILSGVARWVKVSETEKGVKVLDVMPHIRTMQSLLAVGNVPGVPGLDGIVTAPIFGPGGHLHTEPGYDAETRLYFAKNGLEIGDTEPTEENVKAAKTLILEDLLTDFPFKDDASKAHAVGLLLLGFVRPMIDGPTPLHLIDSPTPGTGKGLLASACTIPAMGPNLPSTSAGRDDDEWRKRLTSALIAGGNVVNIDNVTERLDSGVLASAITQPVWEDRVLGSSHTVRVKIRNVWIATGNNTALSQEISRRCVWIRLDSNTEKPWDREGFKYPDLLSWASENRGKLATAALTLIRAWVVKDMPKFSGRVKGSFSSWSHVIGGILDTVEIPGFLGNEAALYDTTVATGAGLADFVKEWWNRYQGAETGAGVLFELASFPDDLRDMDKDKWLGLLEDQLGAGNQASRLSKFGLKLSENRDKVIAGYKIVKGKRGAGGYKYQLEAVDGVKPQQEPQQGAWPEFAK